MRAALLVLVACSSRDQPVRHETPPAPPPPADPVVALASGDGEVCATRASKRVQCWGGGSATREAKPVHDEAKLPTWEPLGRAPADIAPRPNGLHLRLRSAGGCALVSDGVACWGELDQRSHRNLPLTRTTALGELERLAPFGNDALCALRRDGAIACWPAKRLLQILDGAAAEPRLVAADANDPWIDVVENCGLRKSGRVFCWGDNSRGQVTGVGDARERAARLVEPPRPVVFGSFDGDPWCAAIDDGSVVCWPAKRPVLRLPAPADGDRVVQLVPGIYGACALLQSGRVLCWVHGDSPRFPTTPRAIPELTDVISLASVGGRMCAVTRAGRVSCGYGSPESKPFTPVRGLDDAIAVAVSNDRACALRRGGAVRCWEDGAPFDPPGFPPMTQLAMPRSRSEAYVCGVARDRTVWCWGRPACRANACRVRDLQDVVEIAAGFTEFGHTTYYARRDGAVWTWRDDEEEVTRRDDIANAVGLRAGTSTACAIHADRGVSCWGLVGERLNDGHRSSIAEPIEIDLGR